VESVQAATLAAGAAKLARTMLDRRDTEGRL